MVMNSLLMQRLTKNLGENISVCWLIFELHNIFRQSNKSDKSDSRSPVWIGSLHFSGFFSFLADNFRNFQEQPQFFLELWILTTHSILIFCLMSKKSSYGAGSAQHRNIWVARTIAISPSVFTSFLFLNNKL